MTGTMKKKLNVMRRNAKPVRRALLVLAGAGGLLAAGCGPVPPTPNADYQMYALTSHHQPQSCAATPGPSMYWIWAADAVLTGSPSVEVVDGLADHVMTFGRGTGLMLGPTTGEVRADAYSIVVLFRLSEIGGYDRLIDFKNLASDSGLYLQDGALRFYPDSPRGGRVIANDEWVQVVITRTATGTVRGFVDGVQQWQFTDTALDALIVNSADPGPVLTFFLDNLSGGVTTEHSAGAVARIRVFDRPLSTAEIGALGQTPNSPCTA